MKAGSRTRSLTDLIPDAVMCPVTVIMKMSASIHSLSGHISAAWRHFFFSFAELAVQCNLMTHGSCIGTRRETKPKRIRHYARHFPSPLTNVTAQTDKDLNVDVLSGGAFFFFWSGPAPSSYRGYPITPTAHVFINNCGIKRELYSGVKLMTRMSFRLVRAAAFHLK